MNLPSKFISNPITIIKITQGSHGLGFIPCITLICAPRLGVPLAEPIVVDFFPYTDIMEEIIDEQTKEE